MQYKLSQNTIQTSDEFTPEFETLCQKYGLQITVALSHDTAHFRIENKRLIFQDAHDLKYFFNLEETFKKFKNQFHKNTAGPLAKALGKNSEVIVDMTCGAGADSMFMLALGKTVYAFERNPVVALLMDDALRFYQLNSQDADFQKALERFHFSWGEFLHSSSLECDAIYYDPMFPEKKKSSALAKKDMELFKEVVGKDSDERSTLESLVSRFKQQRIIVKRPLKEEPMLVNPTGSFPGKTTRYDLYKNY